jgi:hypothetical protein
MGQDVSKEVLLASNLNIEVNGVCDTIPVWHGNWHCSSIQQELTCY